MGNCFEACLASVLSVDLAEIPDARPEGERASYSEIQAWIHERFKKLLIYQRFGGTVWAPLVDDGLYLLTGQNHRGVPHTVVASRGIIVWDPNTKNPGLASVYAVETLTPVVEGVDLPFRDPDLKVD